MSSSTALRLYCGRDTTEMVRRLRNIIATTTGSDENGDEKGDCNNTNTNNNNSDSYNEYNATTTASAATTATTITTAASILEIRETVLDENIIEAIADVLIQHPFETVQLDYCGAYTLFNSKKQMDRMAKALGNNVTDLRLSEPTFLSKDFLDNLLLYQPITANLTNLSIQDHLNIEHIQSLSNALSSTTSKLQLLDLSRSRLDNIPILALGLSKNIHLQCLKLRNLNLHDIHITEIIHSLINHPTLTILDLSFNHCRNIDAIATLLCNNDELNNTPNNNDNSNNNNTNTTKLRELHIGYQHIWQVPKIHITQLAYSLQRNTTLKFLCLSRNKLTNMDAEYIAKALLQNSTLEKLDLRENRIGDHGVSALAKAIGGKDNTNNACNKSSTGLRWLQLAKNPFGQEGTEALLTSVKENFSIVHVEFSNTSSTAEQVRYYANLNRGGRGLLYAKPSLGLWPLALEKVNKMDWNQNNGPSSFENVSGKSGSPLLDVLYFLLKGPPLFEGLVCRRIQLPSNNKSELQENNI